MKNPEIVDEWHTCHMCHETIGKVFFALNSIFHDRNKKKWEISK